MDINAIWDELKAGLIKECQAALEHAAKNAVEPLGAAVDMLAEAVISKRRQDVAAIVVTAAFRLPRDIDVDKSEAFQQRIAGQWQGFARN